jgi:hypothetical protein
MAFASYWERVGTVLLSGQQADIDDYVADPDANPIRVE